MARDAYCVMLCFYIIVYKLHLIKVATTPVCGIHPVPNKTLREDYLACSSSLILEVNVQY